MTTRSSLNGIFKSILLYLLLCNFNASAQKTNIWIIRDAESNQPVLATNNSTIGLSDEGLARAQALLKVLKREKLQAIYIPPGRVAQQTVAPLSAKVRILPRLYTDSISAFVKKLTRNFQGNNVLIVAQYKDLMPLINDLGVTPPFDELNEEDYDLMFTITIDEGNKRDMLITNYGKAHHLTEIPQQYIIQKFYPAFVPPVNSH